MDARADSSARLSAAVVAANAESGTLILEIFSKPRNAAASASWNCFDDQPVEARLRLATRVVFLGDEIDEIFAVAGKRLRFPSKSRRTPPSPGPRVSRRRRRTKVTSEKAVVVRVRRFLSAALKREREPPRARGVHERARLAVALRRARGRERGAKSDERDRTRSASAANRRGASAASGERRKTRTRACARTRPTLVTRTSVSSSRIFVRGLLRLVRLVLVRLALSSVSSARRAKRQVRPPPHRTRVRHAKTRPQRERDRLGAATLGARASAEGTQPSRRPETSTPDRGVLEHVNVRLETVPPARDAHEHPPELHPPGFLPAVARRSSRDAGSPRHRAHTGVTARRGGAGSAVARSPRPGTGATPQVQPGRPARSRRPSPRRNGRQRQGVAVVTAAGWSRYSRYRSTDRDPW